MSVTIPFRSPRHADIEQPPPPPVEDGTAVTIAADSADSIINDAPIPETSERHRLEGLGPASMWKAAIVAVLIIICSNILTTWLVVTRTRSTVVTVSTRNRPLFPKDNSTSIITIPQDEMKYLQQQYKEGYVIIFEGSCQYTSNYDGMYTLPVSMYSTELYWVIQNNNQDDLYEYHNIRKLSDGTVALGFRCTKPLSSCQLMSETVCKQALEAT
ncbi:unnamed protein product [Cylindrotheca closterium]|uniref:Uncharacterized protein n=1 Tax=Cylindrotheca closterium TaxID=2856 RepID=A0AAD2FNW0_9STRA|nr:unnamed protein product [Cylindrotheca closterium]